MRKARWTTVVTLALVLVMGAVAMAAMPPAPVQTPLNPLRIPQFVQPLDTLFAGLPVVINADLSPKTQVDVSICEYQVNILPPGTPVVGAVAGQAPKTWVFGYQEAATCNNGYIPNQSYLGPVVVAVHDVPTAMTFWNKLPDASAANVLAYSNSVDQTVIWGDPVSLDVANNTWRIDGSIVPWAGPPPTPEFNECWALQQQLVPPATLPAACLNNYGFFAAQPTTQKYASPIPAAVHLHGGEVPSVLDGGPDAWWTANGIYGHGYYSFAGNTADAAAGKATYRYPNGQEPAPTWFHDHMLGATRLNVYAGIAGAYYQIDPSFPLAPGLHALGLDNDGNGTFVATDAGGNPILDANGNPIPQVGELLIPLIIQDRMFDTNGQLFFPVAQLNPEHPFWIPEFVGDTILVNGKAWPFLNVEPRRYRFLVLNGSNARAYELSLMSKTTGLKGPSIWVIGNDQGYLDTAQEINPNLKPNTELAIMPGERYEVVIDFTGLQGQVIEMRNTARTPYVGGSPVNGQTTGRIIRFNVGAAPVADSSFNPVANPTVRVNPMVRLTVEGGTTPAPGVTIHKVRRLTLNEVVGPGGPIEILMNNTLYDGTKPIKTPALPNRPNDFTPIPGLTGWNTSFYSELPHEGETELWELVNITADAHPVHPHLVAFQVLNRQPLDVLGYTAAYNLAFPGGLPLDGWGPPLDYNCGAGAPGRGVLDPATCVLGGNPDPAAVGALLGPPVPPLPQEFGWKDTVMALPNMVTRILVRFAKTDFDVCNRDENGGNGNGACLAPPLDDNSDSIGYDFSPNHGHGYVWHCHIVDHEDNEMMRPFTVNEGPYPVSYVQGVHY